MKITKANVKAKCETKACGKKAEFCLDIKKSFFGQGVLLCRDCLKNLFESCQTIFIPKSPTNMMKKEIKRREEVLTNEVKFKEN